MFNNHSSFVNPGLVRIVILSASGRGQDKNCMISAQLFRALGGRGL